MEVRNVAYIAGVLASIMLLLAEAHDAEGITPELGAALDAVTFAMVDVLQAVESADAANREAGL